MWIWSISIDYSKDYRSAVAAARALEEGQHQAVGQWLRELFRQEWPGAGVEGRRVLRCGWGSENGFLAGWGLVLYITYSQKEHVPEE